MSIEEEHLNLQNEYIRTQKALAEVLNEIRTVESKQNEVSGFVQEKRKGFAKRVAALNSLGHQKWGLLIFNQNKDFLQKSLGLLQLTSQQDFDRLAHYKIGQKSLESQSQKLTATKDQLQKNLISIESSRKKLAQVEERLLESMKASSSHSLLTKKGTLAPPVPGPILFPYGSIQDDNGDFTFFQSGLQFLTAKNEKVSAISEGRVVFASAVENRGDVVILEHDGLYYSVYSHLGKIFVQPDQIILPGQHLGVTANSSLYLELRQRSIPIDPKHWLKVEKKGQL